MKFVSLCLEVSGGKVECDITQGGVVNLDENTFTMRGTLFRKTCRYDYYNKELLLYTAHNSEDINPHSLPCPMDSYIIYGDIVLILRGCNFGEKDFQEFYDKRILFDIHE